MPYATATRPGSHWDRLGLFLCDGIDSFSWIRLRCCDYSRVTRVRVLFTFLATRLRSLRFLASLGVSIVCHPLLSCLPSRFPDVRSLYRVFKLYLAFLATTVVLAPIATPITAPFLLLALRSASFLAFFFRISRFSR